MGRAMRFNDTIFALATAAGVSGVAIIRISGIQAKDILYKITSLDKNKITPRYAHYIKIYNILNQNKILDQCLAIYFPAPASFTGEDVVELHIHGSDYIIAQLQKILLSLNDCRLADKGEFSRRAFFNNKMNLLEVEGLRDLIEASSEKQHELAHSQMSGVILQEYLELRKKFLSIMAYIQTYIDFSDDDIPDNLYKDISEKITVLIHTLQNYLAHPSNEIIRNGISMTLCGAPNAGKSSIMNALSRSDIAIISKHAGTTRDILKTHIHLEGYSVMLYDTAGIRSDSDSEIEQEGIQRAHKRVLDSDIILFVFSVDTNIPEDLYQSLRNIENDKTVIGICNKSDLGISKKDKERILKITPYIFEMSCNLEANSIITEFANYVGSILVNNLTSLESSIILHTRHRILLEKSLNILISIDTKFLQNTDMVAQYISENIDIILFEIEEAGEYIAEIIGILHKEEILDELFSSFCIGK